MSQDTSIERYSFVATFELIAGGKSFAPTEIAPKFLTLPSAADVPLGPVEGDPLRIRIQR